MQRIFKILKKITLIKPRVKSYHGFKVMCEKYVVWSQVSVHYATHPALLMQISQAPCCPNSNLVPRCPLQRGPFFLCIEDLKDFNVHIEDYTSNSRYKVSRSNFVTHLNTTPMFEWCVIRCGSKNGHQKASHV